MAKGGSSLRHIDLRGNELTPDDMSIICPAIRNLEYLQAIDFRGNNITLPSVIEVVAPALRGMPELKHVDLRRNRIVSTPGDYFREPAGGGAQRAVCDALPGINVSV